jgi:hypothetical protein
MTKSSNGVSAAEFRERPEIAVPRERKNGETHHKECGASRQKTQEFVERRAKEESNWTKGQRKRGVKTEKERSKIKKSTKILLTRIVVHTILPVRQ